MEEETVENGIKRKEDGTFDVGTAPGPTEETKIIKKATKELVAEYKEALGESLPLIRPILIAKALEGDMTAIKEIHDRVMDKAKQSTEETSNINVLMPILVKFLNEKPNGSDNGNPQ